MASTRGLRRGRKQEEENSRSLSDGALTVSAVISGEVEPSLTLISETEVAARAALSITHTGRLSDVHQREVDMSVAIRDAQTTQPSIIATTKERKHMADNEPTSLMEFSSDLSEAEAPPPLPVGEYPASIVRAEIKDSAKGNKYLALMFRIEPESYPADFIDGNPEGETLSYNRVVLQDTPQGRYRMRKFLESVGGTLSIRVDPNDLMGLTATVGIVHGKWEGETRAEIAKVLAA